MTNDMTTRNGGEIALPSDNLGMTGQFGRDDISLPVCTLVQPMSKDKGDQPGVYWFPDGTTLEQMNVVVLEIAATRALWGDMELEEGVICQSPDRIQGYTEKPSRVFGDNQPDEARYIICGECPHGGDDQYGRGFLCKLGYTLLLYEREHEFPFLFYVKGTAVKPVKQRIVSPALQRLQRNGKPSPWRFAYSWRVKKIEDKFKYYVPDIYLDEELEAEAQEDYARMSAEFQGKASVIESEEPVAADAHTPEPAQA